MNEQEKIDQFNQDVDNLLKGGPSVQETTDPERYQAARQLASSDFSSNSRARETTRTHLLARANRELPVQNKRNEMNTRFSSLFRPLYSALAFGAFLVMIVIGLGWVLSNTDPQLGVKVTEGVPPQVPVGAGEVYLVLDGENAANPGFVRLPATCLVENEPCPQPESVPETPRGSLNTTFEWSPDFSTVIASFRYFDLQVWSFNREGQTWEQMNIPSSFSFPFWSPDGNWVVGTTSVNVAPSASGFSFALLLARADGSEEREISADFQGLQFPIGWVDNTRFLFVQTDQEDTSITRDMLLQYEVSTDTVSIVRELAPINFLTRENSRLSGIDLSPDRTQLAYTFISTGDERKETEIATLNLLTGTDPTVTVDGSWSGITWSSDNEKFAVTTGRDPNATCQVQIGDVGFRHIFIGSWAGSCEATWSPDGQYVVVPAPAQDEKIFLYVIKASDKTTRQIELPGVGVEDVAPRISWVPTFGPAIESTQIPAELGINFLRQPEGWDSMTALMNGRLALVDGCLRIEDPVSNTSLLLIWRHDFDWQITGGVVEVLDGTGQVVARVGDEISIGGGEVASLVGLGNNSEKSGEALQNEIPASCSGPYWLVGAGEIQLVDDETKVRRVLEGFGTILQNVSLLSPTVVEEMQANYTPYVAPELLATWIDDPSTAPGRRASSPWPVGIEIITVRLQSPTEYWVTGNIVEVTSEEVTNGGRANEIPVQLIVGKVQGTWMITSFVQEETISSSPAPLTFDSDSETIRQRILLSHTFWQALWAEAQINDYVSGTPATQRVQVWVNQPAQARVLSGPVDGAPVNLWISDGQMTRTGEDLSGYGLENFVPPLVESDTVNPHPMTYILPTPLSSLLFPSGLAQRGGTYHPINIETVAGRETLVVEWHRPDGPLVDRFWVDTQTGVILRQQNYGKSGDGALTAEYLITHIQYDLPFPPETFDRLAPFPSAFATSPEDIYTEVATPAPEGEPDISMINGEIYLALENTASVGVEGIVHFPASCLISGEPCPQPGFLAGVPAGLGYPTFSWSPNYERAAFLVNDLEDQVWQYDRDLQTWALLEIPYLIGVVWSPDGQWIVGQHVTPGNQEFNPLLVVSANGDDWYEIMADHSGIETPLAWLDDTHILIQNNLNIDPSGGAVYDEFQVYDTVSEETRVVAGITWNFNSSNLSWSVSPDRSQFIYSLGERNTKNSTVTWVNVTDDSQTSFNLPVSIWVTSWSPNGEWLALTDYVGNSCELYLVHPDGSDLHHIFTGESQGVCAGVWSPNGQYFLVPAYAQTPTLPRLYVINVATGESRLVELPDVGVEFEWPIVSWVP